MTKCAVTTCGADSTRSPDITFYHFPRDPEDLKKWVACCGNTAKTFTGKSAVICSQHFLPSDFHRDLQAELLGLSRKRKLKNGIIPSINVHCYLNDNFKFGSNEKLKHTVKLKQCPVPKETCFSLRGTNYNKERSASSNIARTLQRKKTVSQHDRHNNINIEKKDLQPEKNSEKVVTKNKCHRNSKKKKEESSQSFVNSEIEIKEEKYIIEDELYEETPVPSVVLNNTVHENCSDMSAFVKEEMYDILDTLENEFLGQNKVMQEVKSEIPISKHNETVQTVLTVGKTLGSKTPRVRDRKTSQVKLHTLRTQDNEEYYMFIPENISESSEHEETELNSEIIVKEEMSILEEESRMYEPNRQQGNVENISPNEQDDSQKPVADVLLGKQSEQKMSNSKSKLQKDGVSVQDNNIRTAGRENDSKVILLDPSAIQHGFLLPDSVKQPVFFVIPPSYFNISDKGNTAVEPVVNKTSKCKNCGKTFKYMCKVKEVNDGPETCGTCIIQSKSIYNCLICGKYMHTKELFHCHMNVHKGVKIYTCDYCQEQFVHKILLKKHLLNHSKGNKKSDLSHLSKCKKREKLKAQLNKQPCGKLYECDQCHKQFSSKLGLKNHLYIHSNNGPYKCKTCLKVLSGSSTFRRHMESIHKDYRSYLCDRCGKTYKRLDILAEHMKFVHKIQLSTHQSIFICDYCGIVSKNRFYFSIHMNAHKDNKLLVNGQIVNRSGQFTTKMYSECGIGLPPDHRNVYTSAKCNICGKILKNMPSLKHHYNTIHLNKEACQCNICGKEFRYKRLLREHSVLHTGVKKYLCSFCGMCFSSNTNFNQHNWIHLGIKRYECGYCNKAFTQKSNMKEHIAIHTKILPSVI